MSSNKYSFNFDFISEEQTNCKVGIGITNPSKMLEVDGDINISNQIYKNNSNVYISFENNSSNMYYNIGNIGIKKIPEYLLDVNGDLTCLEMIEVSDINSKENIIEDNNGLNVINQLKPKKFKYIESDKWYHGFIAQDLLENTDTEYLVSKDSKNFYAIQLNSILCPLINSIKELSDINNDMRNKLNL